METDSFFYQLLKQLPQTLFALLGLPATRLRSYRFDSVEIKKSFRIDGLFLPRRAGLPLYFVEVQFQLVPTFYANLFAKVFCYLQENDPAQQWQAVAVFRSRSVEPEQREPYEALLNSPRVQRIYLDEQPTPADAPPGLGILQLVLAPDDQIRELVTRLMHQAQHEIADSNQGMKVVILVEEFLIRRFPHLSREEIRAMFQLTDLRNTRFWQEAHEEGKKDRDVEVVHKMLAKGMTIKEIAALLDFSVPEVRRLAKATPE